MNDTISEVPDDDPTSPTAVCPVCTATGTVIRLDDGTLYCAAHKGIATTTEPAPTEPAPAPVAPAPFAIAGDVEPGSRPITVADDDTPPWPMQPAIRMISSLAIEATLATMDEHGVFSEPVTGWSPPEAQAIPITEAGVILAIGAIIEATDFPRDVLQQLADVFAGKEPNNEGDTSA